MADQVTISQQGFANLASLQVAGYIPGSQRWGPVGGKLYTFQPVEAMGRSAPEMRLDNPQAVPPGSIASNAGSRPLILGMMYSKLKPDL